MNMFIIIGRIVSMIECDDNNLNVQLSVPRQFKNDEGVYENDYVNVFLNGKVSEKIQEYCKEGDLLSVKGNIQTSSELIGTQVSFLQSKGSEE